MGMASSGSNAIFDNLVSENLLESAKTVLDTGIGGGLKGTAFGLCFRDPPQDQQSLSSQISYFNEWLFSCSFGCG
ncbi:hypothetical protein Pla123a_39390 [Posidoniimonas polymericola]|uniref:Uncharacterized protein n=1 Tax=Posidoniimonas polymericola TaxID=2528002 RepID=A0A5C5YFN3_9BACT|nr:hypothetical protein Pla123a_39390 [Posidoniimonas polymericola]